MENVRRLFLIVSLTVLGNAQAVPILPNTGGAVDTYDLKYTLVDSSGVETGLKALVADLSDTTSTRLSLGTYWTGSTGEWISPYVEGTSMNAWTSDSLPNVTDTFFFRTQIGGSGSGDVTFDISSDNPARIYIGSLLNAPIELTFGGGAFQTINTMTLNFTAGQFVYFEVTNLADPSFPDGTEGNPSGLLIRAHGVPEGGLTLGLLGFGLLGLGAARRFIG